MSDMTMPELIVSLHKRITKDGATIAKLEAENERLKDRRCEGCSAYDDACREYRASQCLRGVIVSASRVNFCCNRWAEGSAP